MRMEGGRCGAPASAQGPAPAWVPRIPPTVEWRKDERTHSFFSSRGGWFLVGPGLVCWAGSGPRGGQAFLYFRVSCIYGPFCKNTATVWSGVKSPRCPSPQSHFKCSCTGIWGASPGSCALRPGAGQDQPAVSRGLPVPRAPGCSGGGAGGSPIPSSSPSSGHLPLNSHVTLCRGGDRTPGSSTVWAWSLWLL